MKFKLMPSPSSSLLTSFLVLLLVSPGLAGNLSAQSVQKEEQQLEIIDNLSSAFERVAKRIKPTVVSINAVTKAKKSKTRPQQFERGNSPFGDQFSEEFFNRFFDGQMPNNGERKRSSGSGSGVIISDEGYILTNNHVVDGADELEVILFNEKKYDAVLIGGDAKSDLAVIKITAKNLKPAKLADESKIKVGQWVIAAGNPFNLQQTITAGIVSAVGRSNVGIADYEDFIQTDAAINPGNSGGPLINLRGEVVGINTAIFSKSGGSMGVGFAIPIGMAKNVMNSLIKDGKVTRGYLGVMIQKLDEDLAESFDYDQTKGALVSEVSPDSPAARAGIKVGDIVTKFEERAIKGPSQLRNYVGQTSPEKTSKIEVFRAGKYKTLDIQVGELAAETTEIKEIKEKISNELGVEVTDVTPEVAYKYKLDKSSKGVLITYIERGSIAGGNGLRKGDLILSVDQAIISSTKDFDRVIDKTDLKKGARFTIKRNGGRLFLFVKE